MSLAYSVFLWASLSLISFRFLRPDMLMSGFLYLAAGILLRMQAFPPCRSLYVALGFVLGVGYVAKAPMLPIGSAILLLSLFVFKEWLPAVKMVVVAFALMMAIGSLYFVPLSHARGRFTLGESSVFNYLVHVDLVRTGWYLQNPGLARGSFTHPLQQIFSSPKAYSFALPCSCTHPLRFDPSVWVDGLSPRFVLSRKITTVLSNLRQNKAIALAFATAIGVRLVLIYFRRHGADVSWFRNTWSICFIGIVGCVMYVLVNVEPRYVAAFLVLFWCGIIFSFRIPRNLDGKVVTVATLVVIVPLLLPVSWLTLQKYREGQGKTNSDALAAAELERLGIG